MSEEIYLPRRKILAAALAAPIALMSPPVLASAPRQRDWRAVILDRDRYLELERPQSGEKATFCYYRKGEGWDRRGYNIACTLLRDVVSKKTVAIDLKLIDLIFIISAYLRIKQLPGKVLINSGYRTAEFNSKLEGAALNSMHVQAKAADIRIPGVPAEQMAKLAKAIGVGGVGVYQLKNFLHIDTGVVRTWRGAYFAPHQDSWLASHSSLELDMMLSYKEASDHGRIIYA